MGKIKEIFKPGTRKFHFLKYNKSFVRDNVRTLLILGSESSISWNIRKTFFEKK